MINLKKCLNTFPSHFNFSKNLNIHLIRLFSDEPIKIEKPHPFSRTYQILEKDVYNIAYRYTKNQSYLMKSQYFPQHCDILILGGGLLGSAIAHELQSKGRDQLSVILLDNMPKDNAAHESTLTKEYMFGCLTSQFSNPLHRKMSRFTKEFIRTSKESLKLYGSPAPFIRYTPTGSLLMADLNEADALINIYNEQGNEGNKVKLLTKRKLAELFPWMSLEGIELGLHCLRNEGWYDVTTFREALRVKASAMGTHIIEAEPMQFQFRRMSDMLMAHTKPGQYQNVNDIIIKDREGVFRSITYGILIITETGGPDPGKWLENIFKMIRIGDETNDSRYLQSRLPIISKKRRSYTILSDEGPGMNCPLLLDSSGLFLRREGLAGEYVCSLADDSDNQSIKEKTLQAVANRIPSLANAKITGEFDCEFTYNVFDGCGLLGPHPHYINVYLACGFNTLEPQIAPALSKAICDMIIEGMLFDEMDVSELTIDRLFSNSPMNELISL